MFKKRSKATQSKSAPREPSAGAPISTISDPKPPLSSAKRKSASAAPHEYVKLSVAELQERYGPAEPEEDKTYEEINDDWEEEQLKKNGVLVDKPVRILENEEDPLVKLRARIHARMTELQEEVKTLQAALNE